MTLWMVTGGATATAAPLLENPRGYHCLCRRRCIYMLPISRLRGSKFGILFKVIVEFHFMWHLQWDDCHLARSSSSCPSFPLDKLPWIRDWVYGYNQTTSQCVSIVLRHEIWGVRMSLEVMQDVTHTRVGVLAIDTSTDSRIRHLHFPNLRTLVFSSVF